MRPSLPALLLLAAAACLLLAPALAARKKLKVPKASKAELQEMLATKESAKAFVDCIKKPKKCEDKRAEGLSRLAPMLMRSQGRCRNTRGLNCDQQDEANIKFVLKTLSSRYSGMYNGLMRSLVRGA